MITRVKEEPIESWAFAREEEETNQELRQLSAAEGYAQLKMYDEAHCELDEVDQHGGFCVEVAIRKLDLYLAESKWKEAAIYGEILTEFLPDEPTHFMKYAKALEELGRTDTAIYVLSLAPQELENDPEFQYRMATYELDSGTREEALIHLENAIALDPNMRKRAWMEAKFRTLMAELPWEPRFVSSQPLEIVEEEGPECVDPWDENIGHDDGFSVFVDLDRLDQEDEFPF